MVFFRRRRAWEPASDAITDEAAVQGRRHFLRSVGLGTLTAGGLTFGGRRLVERALLVDAADMPPLGASPNGSFTGDRALTPVRHVTGYNNFWEFGCDKRWVAFRARRFRLDPYALRVDGLVDQPGDWDLERLEALGLEERVYRHRCVEAWAMTVPWTGVPLARLLTAVGVQAQARFVAFQSFDDPSQAPGLGENDEYSWPYTEALRLDEASHELAFLATGLFGHRLPPQNGAPARLVVPWKYGFKSAKSLVRISVTRERPPSFWNEHVPAEYSWLANVDPAVPHPRWSQATERLLGSGEVVPTLPFNGYHLGSLYA